MGDNCEERRGRGRPRKENGRPNTYAVRFTDDEQALIERVREKSGMSKSDFVRLCVQVYTNLIGEN